MSRASPVCNNLLCSVAKKIIYFILFLFPLKSIAQFNITETHALRELCEDRKKDATKFLQFISNSTNNVSLGIPFVLFATGILNQDKAMRENALYVTESMFISTVTTIILKKAIHRPRPYTVDSLITKASAGGGYSFPSGHTSQAFSAATSLLIAYPKWYIGVPAYLWAGSVSFSRMYLGVHYPSDIAGGIIVGAGSAWLAYKANEWMKHKKKTGSNPMAFL